MMALVAVKKRRRPQLACLFCLSIWCLPPCDEAARWPPQVPTPRSWTSSFQKCGKPISFLYKLSSFTYSVIATENGLRHLAD